MSQSRLNAWRSPETRKCSDCGNEFQAARKDSPARFCRRCAFSPRRKRSKPPKYLWTSERDAIVRARYDGKVKGRASEIAAELGFPDWAVKKRAAHLGVCYHVDRNDWTKEEERFLLDWAGDRDAAWIAKKLGRPLASVVLKFKRMKISRRVRKDTYTMTELQLCFGTDHHVIQRWIREGKLQVRKRGTARLPQQGGDTYDVRESDILAFIQSHPMAFRLDKVDQVWFLDLMLAGGLIRRAMKAARDSEAA